MTDAFSNELFVRAPTMGDAESVAELIQTCDITEHGEPDMTLEDLRADWKNPELCLETDAWVVVAPGEQIVGYAVMFNKENLRYKIMLAFERAI